MTNLVQTLLLLGNEVIAIIIVTLAVQILMVGAIFLSLPPVHIT